MNIKNELNWILISIGITLGAWSAIQNDFYLEKWTALCCGFGLFLVLMLKDLRWKAGFLLAFAFLYGFSSVALDRESWKHSAWRTPKKVMMLSGIVVSFPEKNYSQYKWNFQCDQFRMEEGPWRQTKSKVEASAPLTDLPPLMGDRLIIKGLIRFPGDEEPGAKWTKRNLFLKDIEAQIRVKKNGDMIPLGWDPLFFPLRLLQLAREHALFQIEKIYSPEHAQIMKALLVGDKITDSQIRTVFVRSSTSHLLSVSGFHTSVIAGVIFGALVMLRLFPKHAALGASLATLCYMALTGWGVAVQRAGMMAILVWTAWVLGRPRHLVYWLNVALAVILWMDPKRIGDVSFQLSFLSMYGIVLIAPRLKSQLRLPPGLDISVAAFLATYPVVLFHFQNFAWMGIFANLFAVPAFALILPLGFLSLTPGVGWLVLVLTKALLTSTLWFLKMIAGVSWACLFFQQPRMDLILIYYFLGGLILWLGPHPKESQSLPVF